MLLSYPVCSGVRLAICFVNAKIRKLVLVRNPLMMFWSRRAKYMNLKCELAPLGVVSESRCGLEEDFLIFS